ncbi:MAG: sulfatase [Calditrichia bacterium]
MKIKTCSRRKFLGTMAAAGALPLLGQSIPSQKTGSDSLRKMPNTKPRNLVFILSDDHRYDFMSFMGKPSFLQTPGLDRLAREGAHLQNSFVTTSLCSPSRASILTGMYSHHHGVVDNDSPAPEGVVYFPQYLQQHGYKTAFIGKWHMGHHTDEKQPGFDHWVSFPGQGVYYNPVFNVNGEEVERKGYITDILTDYAADWLKQQGDQPFLLYLSHKAVHAMFEPAKRHLGLYENKTPEYPPSMADTAANYYLKPDWVKEQRNSWHGVDYMYHGEIDFDTFYRRYCETLLALDEGIARVRDTLETLDLADSTLLLYMGDNGFCLGEHGLIDKRQMYEESIRVPLLAWAPGLIPPGTQIPQMIQNIDIAPTLLTTAGLQPPENMDGRSFLPLLQGKTIPWRNEIFYEYYWERPFPQTPTMHGIRTDEWKYVMYHGIWDLDELYNLEADPREMNNLIREPEQLERIKEFRDRVYGWLEQTGGMQIPLRRAPLWQAAKRKPE